MKSNPKFASLGKMLVGEAQRIVGTNHADHLSQADFTTSTTRGKQVPLLAVAEPVTCPFGVLATGLKTLQSWSIQITGQ